VANEADDLLKRILDEVIDGRGALGESIGHVGKRLDSFRDETLSNFDGTFLRLENVESEVQAMRAGFFRDPFGVGDFRRRVDPGAAR
jgi:hypothetical protein